ncbi:MAG: EamA family transporter [Muribaculaceae bacterium]|nr:EamA family transporter [Muribaculaceae bacterium]
MTYIIALLSIAFGAIAQYLLKLGVMAENNGSYSLIATIYRLITNAKFLMGIACYAVSLLLWLYVLSQLELSKAYPMVSLGYIFTFILGYVFLGEPVNNYRIIGLCFIIIGVCLIARS